MTNVTRVLRQLQEASPQRTALTLLYNQQPEKAISVHALIAGSLRYARALAKAGIQPGEVIILIFNHGEDLVYSFFGAILHGAVPAIMPFLTEKLSPSVYRASLAALFEISAPAAVLTYPEFIAEVDAARQGSSVRAVLSSAEIPTGNEGDSGDPIPWEELAGFARAAQEIVLLQHSSGTTGLQKGVALSHQAVFNQLDSYTKALHLQDNDVVVSWLPLYHDMGLIAGFLLPILSGIHLVLLSPFDWVRAPQRLMQAISHYHGTLCWLPNFAYNFCARKIRSKDMQGVDLSSWRAVINCSEPMHWKSHQMFLERFQPYGLRPEALATCYAMAENVFAVTQGGIDTPVTVDRIQAKRFFNEQIAVPTDTHEESIPMLSAGRPICNTQVKVVDAQGNDLPDRHLGEIALHSDCLLTGYYHRPDLTDKAFRDDWYLTGDLGYLADSEVYVTGRKKDLIIVGGKNIYPQDLERLAGEVEGVHPGRVVAFGVYNEDTGTEDVVLVAEVEGFSSSSNGLLEQEDERLWQLSDAIRRKVTQGSDIALRQVFLVGRGWLIKTSSGKIARAANREKWLGVA
jgi:fatty-acyl-CoA synthase